MKKTFLLAVLLLFCFKISASHNMGGYWEHSIDPQNKLWTVDFYLITDSFGLGPTYTLTVNGPINFVLYRQSPGLSYPQIPYGSLGCVEGKYYLVKYSAAFTIDSNINPIWATPGPKNFSVSLPCCAHEMENLATQTNHYFDFTIYPLRDAAGNIFFPPYNSQGANPEMVQSAYPRIRNYNDFGLKNMPLGIDSMSFNLSTLRQSANIQMPYTLGYSGRFPLPDVTEDSANGSVLFFPSQRIISAQAIPSSYQPGTYAISFFNKYYVQDSIFLTENSQGVIYFNGQDSTIASTFIQLEDATQSHPPLLRNQFFQYNMAYGDTLQLKMDAFSILGDTLQLIEVKENYSTGSQGGSGQSAISLPQLSSLNANGMFQSIDTNSVELSFIPNKYNFIDGPNRYVLELIFSNKTCEGSVASIRVRVDIEPEAFISAREQLSDSLTYCSSDSTELHMQGSFANHYWSPGIWVNDSLAPAVNLVGNRQGWLYLKDSSSVSVDSIFLATETNIAINTLQFGSAEDILVNSSSSSLIQEWSISNLVKVKSSQNDTLPILGSGDYSVTTQYQEGGCLYESDTINVAEDFLWGTNYGADGYHVDQSIVDTSGSKINYTCKLEIPGETRFFEKIFFFGFENLNPQVPKEISLKITTNYGYQDSLVALITSEGYLEFPVNFDLAPNLSAILEVELDSGIAYHYLSYNQSGFLRNALRFTELGYTTAGGTINYGRRIPLGFKYQGTVGLSSPEDLLVQVYPNPSSGDIKIDWPFQENGLAEVYNQQGQKVATIRLKEGKQIGGFNLAAGLYSLVFSSHPHLKSVKLLIID